MGMLFKRGDKGTTFSLTSKFLAIFFLRSSSSTFFKTLQVAAA